MRGLVGHSQRVQVTDSLETVQKRFTAHEFEYMAVMANDRLIGLCSREKIGMVLGARFGFAMNSQKVIANFLPSEMTVVRVDQPLAEVLALTCSRPHETLYDDVALLDEGGQFLGIIFSQTLVRLQNTLLQESIHQLEGDLQLAREIQLAMLPEQFPEIRSNNLTLRFDQRYLPSGVVSGDFFHVLKISDSSVGIFICDVMGHGVRSAFVTATLRALIEEMRSFADNPGELLSRVNVGLLSILKAMDDILYATAFYMAVDVTEGVIQYAKAGHPEPLVLNQTTGEVRVLELPAKLKGPALGLYESAKYGTAKSSLQAGDFVLLFTDGISEVFDVENKEFGEAGMMSVLKAHCRQPVAATLDKLLEIARLHADKKSFDDDVCLVAMEAVCREN